MTTEDRLDKLTGRHEALAQSAELLGMRMNTLSASVESLTVSLSRLEQKIDVLVESVGDLVRVVHMHETRITRLNSSPETPAYGTSSQTLQVTTAVRRSRMQHRRQQ